jgi:hypothetical protein
VATLIVPPLDEEPWPTLGPGVCEFIETYGVYGPGDLEGQPYRLTDERRAQLYRAYEVHPKGTRLAGRRRFKQVSIEERKGVAKTEFAMEVVLPESHPEGPVRCDGFRKVGRLWQPVGRPMRRPYIPLVSYTVEQTEDLGYNVLKYIIENCDLVDDYDVSDERILVIDGGRVSGKIVPLAGSPNARDGALTTHQHFDEPHRMTLPRLKNAFTTMKENTYKRVGADAWTHTTSTAGLVGEQSVQEDIHEYAEAIAAGKVDDPRMFFFSRYARDDMPMETPEQVMEFLLEASGPNAEWSGDLDGLVARWFEPKTDQLYYKRVWGNQWVRGGSPAFDMESWKAQGDPDLIIPEGATIVAGFAGSSRRNSVALLIVDGDTNVRHLAGLWEAPADADREWEVPRDEIDQLVRSLPKQYDLWRLYGDPTKWGPWLDAWAADLGEKRIVGFDTTRLKPMAYACRNLATAVKAGETPHTASEKFTAHMGNARRIPVPVWDEETKEQLYRIAKERPESPRLIDAATAHVLAEEARNDWLAAEKPRGKKRGRAFSY